MHSRLDIVFVGSMVTLATAVAALVSPERAG